MASVVRTVVTHTPRQRVWVELVDFTTVTRWDPNTPDCRRVDGDGGVGTVYAVTSVFRGRETHLEYTVTAVESQHRVVLRGENATVSVVEDMRLADRPGGGTEVVYRADFTFHGPAKLATPFLRGALRGIADDARRGMTAHLDSLTAPAASVAASNDGPGWEVRSQWKEMVDYREGENRMTFDAAWGVTPHVLYVPDAATWDHVVPEWLVGRRDLVVARLRAESGHTVTDTDTGYARLR